MPTRQMTCIASGCRCMNSPIARPCLRCTHEVNTTHFESAEFICARGSGDELFCGSCGDEIAASSRGSKHDLLASHFRQEHPELSRAARFRERTVSGARYFFFA